MTGALNGIRVIDLSRILGGPYAGQVLGDHGADVIKVEPPTGDDTRTWGPPWWGEGEARVGDVGDDDVPGPDVPGDRGRHDRCRPPPATPEQWRHGGRR